jgi:hypothetical protein
VVRPPPTVTTLTPTTPTITLDGFSIELGMTLDQVTATLGSAGKSIGALTASALKAGRGTKFPGSDGFALIVFRDASCGGKAKSVCGNAGAKILQKSRERATDNVGDLDPRLPDTRTAVAQKGKYSRFRLGGASRSSVEGVALDGGRRPLRR